MVDCGAFEKMPKQGSITAKELGALVKIEPNVIGMSSRCLSLWLSELMKNSTPYANAHRYWHC